MADTKSAVTLAAELKTFLRAKNRVLDVSDNSLMNDLILSPYSTGGKAIMDQVEVVKALTKLSETTGTDLDSEGATYKLERLPGNYAIVTVILFANTAPTANVVIPAATEARTIGNIYDSPITFQSTAEYTFALSDIAAYYSHDRNRYEFEVSFRATQIGTSGNIASNLVSVLTSVVNQIDGVTNLVAATGGSDEEDDDDFRKRIALTMAGRDINTVNGLRAYLMALGFVDGNALRVEEEGHERATGVDAFVIDYSSTSITERFIYRTAQQRYYFSMPPVLEVTSVISETTGQLASSTYHVNIDSTTPLRRSTQAQDYIEILPTASLTDGTGVNVTYNYSSLINQSQASFELPDNKILTADVLLKRAYPLSLFITATLTLKSNADGPATRNKVKNALSQFLAVYRLGDDIQKSDLVIVIQEGYGDYPIENVDAVVINSYYLQDEFGNIYNPVNEVIVVGNNQHAVYGSATVL